MKRSGRARPGSSSKPTGVNEDTANTEDVSPEDVRTLASTKYRSDRGNWSIVIASSAVADLRQMRKGDSHVFGMFCNKIEELSQGLFSDDNQRRLIGLNSEGKAAIGYVHDYKAKPIVFHLGTVPIYEVNVSRDLRIVYQIDLDTDVETNTDKQVIRLYGTYTHNQMDNRLRSLISYHNTTRRGKEYRRRCSISETLRMPGKNVIPPAEFPHKEEIEAPAELQVGGDSTTDNIMANEELLALYSVVASEKFILWSKSLVESTTEDFDGRQIVVSPAEKEVIYYDSASFVLGRCGILGIEKAFEEAEEGKPRQVFITQSPALAQKVQEYYHALVRTNCRRSALPNQTTSEGEPILVDLADERIELFGLPAQYSLLEDRHFPLFLSFDQLCSLLEEDFKCEFGRLARSQTIAGRLDPNLSVELEKKYESDKTYIHEKLLPAVRTMEKIRENKNAIITFDVFVFAYWPHFGQSLTYDLDPALVYNEFIGVIEGSEATLTCTSGVLSRDEYLTLGYGSSLLPSQRGKVYTLYESYRKARSRLGGYDAAERHGTTLRKIRGMKLTMSRTHALLTATQDGKCIPGPKIDALYVDEASDKLDDRRECYTYAIAHEVLCNLCNNPHGILIAGDTAQAISASSSFRFNDLKGFFERLEDQDEAVRSKWRDPVRPAVFHLSVNYRSHSGIVNCASAIVELVSKLFPNSIDKLTKETGIVGGPKPIFFSGWKHSIQISQFLRDQGDVKIDFGANQVILVRNDAAREALRAQVGEIGLILTLHESKGLEFDDVLLYNFFEDSAANATTWRIVFNGLDGNKYYTRTQFNPARHAVICTELKNLYVGITRARNHCWIMDVSKQAWPMKAFWTEQNLVEQCGPGDPIPQLSASSSTSEWEDRGRTLFERQLYPQAMLCFRRARLTLEHDIAAAYEARKQARLLQATKPNQRESRAAFRHAAEKFMECGKIAASKQQNSCYLCAADCYAQAEDWKYAAETFVLAREFAMAAKNFHRAGCFNEAVDLVKTHQEDIQEGVAELEEIFKAARLEYCTKG